MKTIRLTKSETEIMDLLWEKEGESLTATDIVEASPDRSWKSASVHLLINNLLEKGMLEVGGFKRTTKNYARTFCPVLSKTDFLINQMDQKTKEQILFSLLDDMGTDTLEKIQETIASKLD